MPTKSFQDNLEETETENSIKSAVGWSDALLFINKLKDYLIGFRIDKNDSLNYLSRKENIIFWLRKKSIRNTEYFSQAVNLTYF